MRTSPFISRFAIVAAAATWLHACNASTFGSGNAKSEKSDDGRRPSETGEGLVGYLRDPEALEYQRSNGALSIRGGSGAIAVDQGSPAGLTVCLQQAAAATVEAILNAGQQFGGSDVTTLAETQADADGGFAFSVPEEQVDQTKLLSINVTGQCRGGAPTSLPVDKNSVVFMDFAQEGRFSNAKTVGEANESPVGPSSVADSKEKTPSVFTDGGYLCTGGDARCTLQITFRITIQGQSFPDDVIDLTIQDCTKKGETCNDAKLRVRDGDSISLLDGTYTLSFYSPLDDATFVTTVGEADGTLDAKGVLHADLRVGGGTASAAGVENPPAGPNGQ